MTQRQDHDLSLMSHPKAWPCKDRIFLKRFDETLHTMDTAILFESDGGEFAFIPDGPGENRKGGLDMLETLVLKEGWKVD